MKILIIHNSLNDSRSVSGVLRHYVCMANEWNAAGHQTDFLAAKAGWPQLGSMAPQSRLISSDSFFDATNYLAQTWRYLPAYAFRGLSCHWVRLPERYDLFYASGQFILEVHAARVLARRQGAKFAVKIQHVLAPHTGRRTLFDRMFIQAERISARMIHRHAALVMALSQPVAGDYNQLERRLGIPPTPIRVIGCGIDMPAFQRPGPAAKTFDCVFLGRLHQHKGVFDLPHIWKGILNATPGARLLVIGEGPHRERMRQLFEELGIVKTVEFRSGLSEESKIELLHQSRVGLSTSYEEGWGIAVTEFLAAGLPVVAYRLPVFESVFPGQLELVTAGDQAGFVNTTVKMLGDPEMQRRRGLSGQAFVQRYDYRQIAPVELAALQSALG